MAFPLRVDGLFLMGATFLLLILEKGIVYDFERFPDSGV
jgi:hypothetical protein